MIERSVKVINQLGIHARPASMIVQGANKFKSRIWIVKDGIPADAKSIMNVMMLAAAYGSEVVIRASGDDEQQAVTAIEELFNGKFNED